MKIGVLFTGGKDSALALIKSKENNEIASLITVISENKESYMFHTPNIELTKYQAEAMGIPINYIYTKGEKEKEIEDLKKGLEELKKKIEIEGIVTGAIRSNYQYSRIKKICEELKLKLISPLWNMDELKELEEIIKNEIKAIIVSVSAYPLNEEFLGKQINSSLIEKFRFFKEKYGFNPSGEGGEYETFVLDAPIFKKKIEVEDYEIIRKGENSAEMIIKKILIKNKSN